MIATADQAQVPTRARRRRCPRCRRYLDDQDDDGAKIELTGWLGVLVLVILVLLLVRGAVGVVADLAGILR